MKCRLNVIFAEANIKPSEFAKEIGINRGTLSQLKNNKQDPTLKVAYKITKGLRKYGISLTVEEIWIEEEEE